MTKGRLTTIKPRLQEAKGRQLQQLPTTKSRRLTGRKLQERRLAVWARNPTCAMCGKLCDFPAGFELDHTMPLFLGGEETEANCQVLCVRYETINGQLVKVGCHAEKTAAEARMVR